MEFDPVAILDYNAMPLGAGLVSLYFSGTIIKVGNFELNPLLASVSLGRLTP